MSDGNKFITQTLPGFPAELEWANLRAAGLEHLGNLAGKVWTDHNVHDPGITILETLCYALTDLAYRTNLPPADIFARDPADKSKENNFFSPSDMLTCNPVTITDFRKMLIDIDGVRNAWLEDSFYNCNNEGVIKGVTTETSCSSCYNGLYRVYLELDKEYNLADEKEKEIYEKLIGKIRKALMAHRNLCEDYIDIRILCHKKIGICADIELTTGTEAEEVYGTLVQNLSDYFGPSPRFYTLSQLLEQKKKAIEDIFGGRPYNITESHGFVDTEEFESLPLRKELHLSDIYKVILNVPGVRLVRDLAWVKDCGPTPLVDRQWKWIIPENHIPEFSAECSGLRFSINGMLISTDNEILNALSQLRGNGKVLYKMPSPYLDLEIPKGNYRDDLGEYISIQTEFPRVYGIEQGGLPSDAPTRRKAQALQLKGYLLFFDQLLANYVAQLKNIRSLYSFNSSDGKGNPHTYFLGKLADVPEMDKLTCFAMDEPDGMSDTLALPVKQNDLEDAIADDSIKTKGLDSFMVPLSYPGRQECDVATDNLHQDIFFANLSVKVHSTSEYCWFFYFPTTLDNTVLLGKKIYPNETEARRAADLVRYAGSNRDNFRTYINKDNRFSFTLELKIRSYSQYLQRLLEDEQLYNDRRQGFLDHLLSRFAERFTDYALLSYGMMDESALVKNEIKKKDFFLENYGDISSNRGKGYDYVLNGWNNGNLSGFEKRVIALAGMGELKRRSLCNFVVEPVEKYYRIRIIFNDKVILSSTDRFDNQEFALQVAKEFFAAVKTRANYRIGDCGAFPFHIRIYYKAGSYVQFYHCFENRKQAERGIDFLFSNFIDYPMESSIYEIATPDTLQLEKSEVENPTEGEIGDAPGDIANDSVDPESFTHTSRYGFYYFLGFGKESGYFFKSVDEFDSRESAAGRAKTFYKDLERIQLTDFESKLALQSNDEGKPIVCVSVVDAADEDSRMECENLIAFRKSMLEAAGGNPSNYEQFIASNIDDDKYTLVYRLVDKDNPLAMYVGAEGSETFDDADKSRRDIFRNSLTYDYTRISFSENIVVEYKDEQKVSWFHYRVVAENEYAGKPAGLILFESVKGFQSKESAYSAFRENLEEILMRAMYDANYGSGRFISLEKLIDRSTGLDSRKPQTLVYIPELTIEIFSWSANIAVGNLIRMAKQYPVRYTTKEEDEFYEIFPCEVDERDPGTLGACCNKKDGRRWYYFVLSDVEANEQWKSTKYFGTTVEALKAFYFFLLLLKYPGNYIVEKNYCECKRPSAGHDCKCTWRVYLREVLLESRERYEDKIKAWEAVEKLVCMSQTDGAFQAYLAGQRTGYSFDISRHKGSLIHPYKYDTRVDRDRAIEKLFGYFRNRTWQFPSVYQVQGDTWVLRDTSAKDIAFVKPPDPYKPLCDYFLSYLPERITNGQWVETDNGYALTHAGENILWVDDQLLTIEEWKKKIRQALCYFPITKKDAGKDESGNVLFQYRVEIRLPGYGSCEEIPPDPCNHETLENCSYMIAWKADCCFQSCGDAWLYLENIVEYLSDRCNYRAVFDCECGPYGIVLLCNFEKDSVIPCRPAPGRKKDQPVQQKGKGVVPEFCSMEVLAFNPQSYPDPKSDCEAIERASKLINVEGLHLVEHILLRPRCEEQCAGEGLFCFIYDPRKPCRTEMTNCTDWEWKEFGEPDPCRQKVNKPVRFIPAADPYSFIATVVLPAWSTRFRKEENRQIIENLLYREAPAHILLRILWLTPKDLCAFEEHYRSWQRYLGGSYSDKCVDDNAYCDFIDFLFRKTTVSGLLDCNDCDPCKEIVTNTIPCSTPIEDKCSNRSVQGNISELFCWPPPTEKSTELKEEKWNADRPRVEVEEEGRTEPKPSKQSKQQVLKAEKGVELSREELLAREKELEKERSHWISKRRTKYIEVIDKILGPDTKNKLIVNIKGYLAKLIPVPERFTILVKLILEAGEPFMEKDKRTMLSVMSWCLLDKLSFRKKNNAELKQLGDFFKKIRKHNDVEQIFEKWHDKNIGKLQPEIEPAILRKMVTGKST